MDPTADGGAPTGSYPATFSFDPPERVANWRPSPPAPGQRHARGVVADIEGLAPAEHIEAGRIDTGVSAMS